MHKKTTLEKVVLKYNYKTSSFLSKTKLLQNAIRIFNNFRSHLSNYMLIPIGIHKQNTIKMKQY